MSSSSTSASSSSSNSVPESASSNVVVNPLTGTSLWPGLLTSSDTRVHRELREDEPALTGGNDHIYNQPLSMGSTGLTSLVAPDTTKQQTTHPSFIPDYLLGTGYADLFSSKQSSSSSSSAAASASVTTSSSSPYQDTRSNKGSSPLSTPAHTPYGFSAITHQIPGQFSPSSSSIGHNLLGSPNDRGNATSANNLMGRDLLKPPTLWNNNDRCPLLDVSQDGLGVTYIGSGKTDSDAAALRANRPMLVQAGIYYYEVEIISKGRDGYIGIGFSSSSVSLKRLPGWELDSWGYHGDDGHKFCCSGTGQKYGPTFTTGDVIGCCVNFANKTAFFTKNGINLGVAFTDIRGRYFPSVGMRTPHERILANFGDRPFRFAIQQYIREEKARLWQAIHAAPLPALSVGKTRTGTTTSDKEMELPVMLKELVLDHLLHHGYHKAAQTFARDALGLTWSQVLDKLKEKASTTTSGSSSSTSATPMVMDTTEEEESDNDEVILRKRIYDAVVKGNINEAYQLVQEHFPQVFTRNSMVLFQLRCQEFIELMREYTAAQEEPAMDIDDDDDNHRTQKKPANVNETTSNASQKMPASSTSTSDQLLNPALQKAMAYGQKLQEDYQHDQRASVKETLLNIFSLFAYPDPRHSVVAYLLDPNRRQPVAEALNSAIVVSLGRSATSSLERVYRQTATAMETMAKHGIAGAGLLSLKHDGQIM